MKTIYLQCNAGASGDMVVSALAGLLDDPREFVSMIDSAGIPGLTVALEKGEMSAIAGNRVRFFIEGEEEGHGHHHHHTPVSDVLGLIRRLNVSDRVKEDACAIYGISAEAEAKVHGKPVDMVHFHEVGALDAVADVVGTCMLIERLSPDRIVSSPLRTGFGEVHCAHGVLPVPAPATANILVGIPAYAGDEEGEFCTPTGAAIVKYFADSFGPMPMLTVGRIGCGLGSKVFRTANILRAFSGEETGEAEHIKELTCNIDDMSPEDLAGIIDLLLKADARDAFIRPCLMKKGRPGFELTCLAWEKDRQTLMDIIFSNTSTSGIRVHDCDRYAMSYRHEECDTEYGRIRVKIYEGFGKTKWKPEYDDLQDAARKNGVSVKEVRDSVVYKPK